MVTHSYHSKTFKLMKIKTKQVKIKKKLILEQNRHQKKLKTKLKLKNMKRIKNGDNFFFDKQLVP